MDPFGQDSPFNREPPPREAPPDLGILSQIHNRLTALEKDNVEIRRLLDASQKSGAINPELVPHLAHIAAKHFYHDRPDVEPAAVPVPKFDAFTGQPLN